MRALFLILALVWAGSAQAQMLVTIPFANTAASSCAPGNTTWNPSDKDSSITLSNSDLTATETFGGANRAVRSVNASTCRKLYFEFVCTNTGLNSDGFKIGFGNSSASLTGGPGDNHNSIGIWLSNTLGLRYSLNGSNFPIYGAGSGCGGGNGNVYALAADFTQTPFAFWFRNISNAPTWGGGNGGAPGNDPVANTGGIADASMAAGPYYIYWAGNAGSPNGNPVISLCVQASCGAGTPPTGYEWLGGAGSSSGPSFVDGGSCKAANTCSVTLGAAGSNTIVIIMYESQSNTPTVSMTAGGTAIQKYNDYSGVVHVQYYYVLYPSGYSGNTVTVAPGSNDSRVYVAAFSNVNQAIPFVSGAFQRTTGSTAGGCSNLSAPHGMLFSFSGNPTNGAGNYSAGASGWTDIAQPATWEGYMGYYPISAPLSSYTVTTNTVSNANGWRVNFCDVLQGA